MTWVYRAFNNSNVLAMREAVFHLLAPAMNCLTLRVFAPPTSPADRPEVLQMRRSCSKSASVRLPMSRSNARKVQQPESRNWQEPTVRGSRRIIHVAVLLGKERHCLPGENGKMDKRHIRQARELHRRHRRATGRS